MGTYEVGQTVHIGDVNRRGTQEGKVTKVGRSLVTVENSFGQRFAYRMDTGVINDAYGHGWIRTEAEIRERDERAELDARLHAVGLRVDYGQRIPTDRLRRVVEASESRADA